MVFKYWLLCCVLYVAAVAALPAKEATATGLREARDGGGSVSAGVQHDSHGNTAHVNVNKEIWSSDDGKTHLNGYAGAQQHFGGGGNSRPEANGGLTFSHHF